MRKWTVRSTRTLLQRPPWLQVDEQDVELPNGQTIDIHRVPLSDLSSVLTAGRVESLASLAGITTGLAVLRSA